MTDRARGIFYLIIAVICFGAVDGLSKIIIHDYGLAEIMLARYAPAFIGLLLFALPRQGLGLFSTGMIGIQLLRGLVPAVISLLMVLAVKYLPLAEATTILFAGPFFVVAFSGWMLGERVKASSWFGVAAGFLAVLVVARPGFSEVSAYTIFPALSAVLYALFQIISRRLGSSGESPSTMLAWTLLVGNVAILPFAIADWRMPTLQDWGLIALIGANFGVGQFLLARAFTLAPANVLTPFTYFQIISAIFFGLVIFGEVPDMLTIIGIAMIIAAGAYVFGLNAPEKT